MNIASSQEACLQEPNYGSKSASKCRLRDSHSFGGPDKGEDSNEKSFFSEVSNSRDLINR